MKNVIILFIFVIINCLSIVQANIKDKVLYHQKLDSIIIILNNAASSRDEINKSLRQNYYPFNILSAALLTSTNEVDTNGVSLSDKLGYIGERLIELNDQPEAPDLINDFLIHEYNCFLGRGC